jgi:putative ABC transport system ATP-binding protein
MSSQQDNSSPQMAKTVFSARNLGKRYTMGEVTVDALAGVDLDISAGEFLVMLGPSGSGKSTLLNIIGGLDTATSGELFYEGNSLIGASDTVLTRFRRKHIGFVFQFYNLIPSLSALENVAIVTEIADSPMPPEEALALVGLGERMNHFPAQLSGGEQQRVAIARAIAKKPEILLCDEPTGALDSKTGALVLQALQTINREIGTTVVVITHNAAIGNMADRVIHMADGTIREQQHNSSPLPVEDIHW